MDKVKESLKKAKKCLGCGGYLEPKFGDYHPICKPKEENGSPPTDKSVGIRA